MYTSFYTAARGVIEQQSKLDVVANNLANINNYGYKPKSATFSDLMYYNLNNYNGEETKIKAGTGIVVEKTDTDFSPAGFITTESDLDFTIEGPGFFMVQNPDSGEVTYTRNGHFSLSQRGGLFFLVNDNGNYVLDGNGLPITVSGIPGDHQKSGEPAVCNFNILDGMLSNGKNEFSPMEKNGNAFLLPGAIVRSKTLEPSGVNAADEFSRMIESQRAYSYAMKMVQTSDEVVNTVNSLRQ